MSGGIGLLGALGGFDRLFIAVGGVLTAGWLAVAGAIRALREPRNPHPAPETTDLGPEPPAVVNLLVSNFRVRPDAVPATLLDLAARRVTGRCPVIEPPHREADEDREAGKCAEQCGFRKRHDEVLRVREP